MKFFLRPISESDTESIVRWRNTETVRCHCMTKTPITVESHLLFYKEKVITGKYKQFIVECLEEHSGVCSYPIATVYLKDMDYENKRCELCIFTSSDVEWNSEGQTIAIEMLVDKAFNEYGMHKVYSYVFKKFPDEEELLKKAGFAIEAVFKDESITENGLYEDVTRMCIFNK